MDEWAQLVEIRLTCRLCFGSCPAQEARSLFENDLTRKLIAFASVQIQEIEGMPMVACSNCSNLINIAYNFKCQIEKSGQKFDQTAITGLPTLWPTMSVERRNDNYGLVEANWPKTQGDVSEICSLLQNEPSTNDHEQIILDIINSCGKCDASDFDEDQLSEIMCALEEVRDTVPPKTSENSNSEAIGIKRIGKGDCNSEDEIPQLLRTKRHKCNYCVKSFADLDSLEKHSVVHKKIYVCYLCEAQFFSIYEVQRHGKIAHALNWKKKCADANISTESEKAHALEWKEMSADANISTESEKASDGPRNTNLIFICEHCSRHFKNRELMVSHLRCHVGKNRLLRELEEKEEGSVEEFATKDVQKSVDTKTRTNTDRSYSSVLGSADRNFSMDSRNNDNIHHSQRQIEDDSDEDDVSGKKQCHQCGKFYKNIRTLRKHLRNRSCRCQDENQVIVVQKRGKYERPYQCNKCCKAFSQAKFLAAHEERHTLMLEQPRRYLCEICSKCFVQQSSLATHRRSHTGVKPYVCKICEKAFIKKSYLSLHLRMHSGEKPYMCQYCSRSFSRADTLTRHITMHTGEAKYQCKLCPKSYRRLTSLKEHVYTHTGQMPYACKFCNKKYNNGGSLYAHKNKCKLKHTTESVQESQTTSSSTDSGVLSQDEDNSISEFLILEKDTVSETAVVEATVNETTVSEITVNETTIIEPQNCQLTIINVPVKESVYVQLMQSLLDNESDMCTVDVSQLRETSYDTCT